MTRNVKGFRTAANSNSIFTIQIKLDPIIFTSAYDWIKSLNSPKPKWIKLQIAKNLPNLELIYFVLSKQRIFDDSFDLENIATFLPDDIYTVKFRFIKGFDIDRFYTKNKYISIEFKLEFYFSKFEFYSTKKLINSCSDLKSTRQSIINGLFHNHVYFYKSNYKSPICLLLLRNCSVRTFGFEGFINTFYKTNVLSFEPILDMNIITNEGDISWKFC